MAGYARFLLSLWQRGALIGDTADAAFRVKCDDENNPPADRDAGGMLAQVLVAPSQPFEFIEVRLGRQDNEFEIQEPIDRLRQESIFPAGGQSNELRRQPQLRARGARKYFRVDRSLRPAPDRHSADARELVTSRPASAN